MRTDMSMRIVGGLRVWHSLVLLVFVAISVWGVAASRAWAQTPVPANLVQAATPMLPYMDWLVDPSGTLSVEDMAAPAQQSAFRPLHVDKIDRESGTVWLRFTLAPRVVDTRPSTYLLDMGEGVPGTPTLYIPKHNVLTGSTTWQDFTPSQRSIFLMPDAQTSPTTAYIKMSGMPGLWFAPMLRTPHNAATALERLLRPAVIVVLGVVMLLCLLRGLAERGEWRFWTSLYTGAALLHSVWGVPMLAQGVVPMEEIAAVLAPGVALMLLPHVGRHLMRTREKAKVIDVQYILLALPGAALALLPLVPGFSWTIRYLDLWPLGTLLFVPTTLGAWMMGLAGARRFLLGCLLPPLATAAGLMGIGSSFPTPLLATAPLWGVALSALIIAGTAATYAPVESEAGTRKDDPLNDPALRIVTPEELAQEASTPLSDPIAWEKNAPHRIPSDSTALAWEEKLRVPMDVLLREGAALGTCSLPPVARQHTQKLQETVRDMLDMLAQPLDGTGQTNESIEAAADCFDLQQLMRDAHDYVATSAENKNIALSWFMPPHLSSRFLGDGRRLALCVRLLLESAVRATSRGGVQVSVRRVPESVDPGHLLFSVTDTGSGMPPHDRSSMAVARAWELAAVHRGFLGVECSPHGTSVSFTVRLVAASTMATGVSDADVGLGRGMPSAVVPESTLATPTVTAPSGVTTQETLELINDTSLEASAEKEPFAPDLSSNVLVNKSITGGSGTQSADINSEAVGKGLRADAAVSQAPQRVTLPRIIIADDSLSNRQLLAFFLEGLPYSTVEARSPDEVAELYTNSPAALTIFDGDMPEDDTLNAVSRIRAFEAEYSLPGSLILALTTDDSRWEFLHAGGFTHALVKPVSRSGLRRTVQELLPEGTVVVPPLSMAFGTGTTATDAGGLGDTIADHSPIPFGLSETERAQDEADATQMAWMDDTLADSIASTMGSDEIIDTGEPLPTPEPLRMAPDTPPASSNATKGAANKVEMVLPVMETATEKAVVHSPASQKLPDMNNVMPELAPMGAGDTVDSGESVSTAASISVSTTPPISSVTPDVPVDTLSFLASDTIEPDSIISSDGDDAEAEIEEVYPYPSHVSGNAVVANTTEASHVPDHKVASLDTPMPVVAAQEESPAISTDLPATETSTTSTSASGKTTRVFTNIELEPAVSSVKRATPVENLEWVGEPMPVGSAVSSQSGENQAKSTVSAIPAWMRESVVSKHEATTGRAPIHAAEWVGDPVPIIRPSRSKTEDSPDAEPAVAVQDVTPPAVSFENNTNSDDAAPQATTPVEPEANPIADMDMTDGPSRIEDLLLPFTQSTIRAEEDIDGDIDLPVQDPEILESQQTFIPLSLTTASPAASAEQSPAPATKAGEQSRAERLSLIPVESSLMDFIISPEPVSAKVQEKPLEKTAETPSKSPTITLTAVPSPRKVATATLVLKSSTKDTESASAKDTTAASQTVASQTVAPQVAAKNPAPVLTATATAAVAAPQPSAQPSAQPSVSPVEAIDSPIPTMLKEFDEAMAYARGGYARKNIQAVLEAAEYIAGRSETCGLRVLARMARCVGEAAKASDIEALNNLLPELETAVERNKIALQKK